MNVVAPTDAGPRAPARAPGGGAVAIACVAGRSVVTTRAAASPLRLLSPRNHGTGAWVFTSTLGGGLVDGDQVTLDVDVGAGATALLATQSSTKVYRSPRGTRYSATMRVAAGATLVVLPDPIVCFAGARYTQRIDVALASGGALVLADAYTAGRVARGERWAFDRFASRVVVERDGVPLVHDGVLLDRVHGPVAARMGPFDVFATVIVAGLPLAEARASLVRRVAATPIAPAQRGPGADVVLAASSVGDEVVVVRAGATSTEALSRALRHHLSFVVDLLGDDPWSRKW